MEDNPQPALIPITEGNNDLTLIVPWRGREIILITGIAVLIFLACIAGLRVTFNALGLQSQNTNTQILLSICMLIAETIALTFPVYLIGIRPHKSRLAALGLKSISIEWILLAGFLGFMAIPFSALVAFLAQAALGRIGSNPQLPFLIPAGFSWPAAIAMVVLGGIIAPFAEEFFFRGMLYTWLDRSLGKTPGILISSLVFGALHGDLVIGTVAFALGILLAWSYERSKSLWAAFIIHAINNGVKIVLLYLLLATGLLDKII